MSNFTSQTLEQTREFAADWLNSISKPREEATVVGLSGHLGAGKTAFVKVVANLLGIKEEITSPTFVIMKMYETKFNIKDKISNIQSASAQYQWKRLIHIDAYRLERYEELEVLNWEQLVADPGNIFMVEWPENACIDTNKNPELIRLGFEIKDGKYNITGEN